MFFATSLLFSCADNFSEDNGMFLSEQAADSQLKSDLTQYALDYEYAYSGVLYYRGDSLTEEKVKALQGLDKCVENFRKRHDIYGDLSFSQKERLVVSEDSAALMRLDTDVMLEFFKKNKSREFYEISRRMFKEGYINLSIEDIVNDAELYLNEKFALLTVRPSLNASRAMTRSGADWPTWSNIFGSVTNEVTNAYNKAQKDKNKSKEEKECDDQYQKDIALCEKEFEAEKILIVAAAAALAAKTLETGATVTTGVTATTGVGGAAGVLGTGGALIAEGLGALGAVALAEVHCEQCKNQAEKDYNACIKSIKDE